MTAVLLALASAALFGGMTVAVRIGLRGGEAGAAALATVLPALGVALVASAFRPHLHGAWPFLLAGLIAPGGSQILFTLAVKEAGSSRTSVAVGAAPLVAVAIALVALGEPVRAPLLLGALAVVGGGLLLAVERDRPGHLRPLGLLYAGGAAVLFATRDNLARALHGHATPGDRRRGHAARGHGRGRALDTAASDPRRARPARTCRACCSGSPTSACSRRTSADA